MDNKRLFLISFFGFVFLVVGLLSSALGAALGFNTFSETQQGVFMLILPCCGLPLVVGGSTATITIGQVKAQNTQTFIRMCILGILITGLLTFGITMILATIYG